VRRNHARGADRRLRPGARGCYPAGVREDHPASSFCPSCDALRVPGPECPRCGVIYAKARPRTAPGPRPGSAPRSEGSPGTSAPPPEPPAAGVGDARGLLAGVEPAVWEGHLDAARGELRVRTVAPPIALLLAAALVASGPGHMLVRTFLSMWIHELGHAVAAWLCGFAAFPGPWRTPVSQGRHGLMIAVVAVALAALTAWGWRARRPPVAAMGIAALLAQLVCTLLPLSTARSFFIFGGDAGAMAIGAALVATIWTDPEGPLGRGWLRWGFLVIGACSFADAFHTWLRAAADRAEIPLGEIEGVGLSDASALWRVHGWSLATITARYVTLGVACLVALAVGWAVAVRRARLRVREAEAVR
jgi:hypothetical protein